MKDNLLVRFLIIIGITLLSAWITWTTWPPRLGIDLAGGTSLLYELDTSKIGPSEDVAEVAARVIEILRKRVDPLSQKNMIWRVVGGKRIQIQMPYPPKATLEARIARDKAFEELQKAAWKRPEITNAAARPAAERAAAFEKFAPRESEAHAELMKLGEISEKLQKAEQDLAKMTAGDPEEAKLRGAKYEAKIEFDEQLDKVMGYSVDVPALKLLLQGAEVSAKNDAREELKKLPATKPLFQKQIETYAKAYLDFVELSGGGVDDPAELQRLVTKAGVLDFRITVPPFQNYSEYLDAQDSLRKNTSTHPLNVSGRRARWFQIDAKGVDNFKSNSFVTTEWQTLQWVLCYDDTQGSLTHNDPARKQWRASAGAIYNNPAEGGIVLPFNMDAVGANYMGELTSNNMHQPMAILLDDRAMSAPNINGRISESGVITFGRPSAAHPAAAVQKEANELKQIMDAGSLPATLFPEPISVEEISPDMGAENIEAGLRSSVYAVLAVIGFMLIYYTIAGAFANVAMLMNLLLVLAVMAGMRGTFTLPGIAGLVLTLGMAVDANVLINERIREEMQRGASLWMAIKQGYDRVFWTIFDSNLTTALTSIVLIYVGSEEVKGFGITLLIGLCISFFTALYVTRTLIMAFVKWGLIRKIEDPPVRSFITDILSLKWLRRGIWPFLRVITISNVDWIGKRYYFWTISAIITVFGIAAFLIRGEDKYDLEFRGGTQITMQVKAGGPEGKGITREEISDRLTALARSNPALRELEGARVYQAGDVKARTFKIETTIAAKGQEEYQAAIRTALNKEFGAKLAQVEFLEGGTISFQLHAPPLGQAAPTREEANEHLKKIASQPGLEDLQAARIEIGDASKHEYNIVNLKTGINTLLLEPLANAFSDVLETVPRLSIRHGELRDLRDVEDAGVVLPITEDTLDRLFTARNVRLGEVPSVDITQHKNGVAVVLDEISPPQTREQLQARIDETRHSARFETEAFRNSRIIPLLAEGPDGKPVPATEGDTRKLVRAVLITSSESSQYKAEDDAAIARWRSTLAGKEWEVVQEAMARQELFKGHTSFDAVVASQAKTQAIIAILLALVLIIIYVWVRFGGIWYGVGAIVALIHDAVVALAFTVLSGWLYTHLFGGKPFLLISDFKINLTAIAAYLTVIGYSVNDTIVIFDRVRELRGKAHVPVTRKIINDAINQCFGRTIWTSFTVFTVLLIMYIFGGDGVRGFCFAMLGGVITGVYSTLAIASPMLLITGTGGPKTTGPRPENPFMRKEPTMPGLPEAAG